MKGYEGYFAGGVPCPESAACEFGSCQQGPSVAVDNGERIEIRRGRRSAQAQLGEVMPMGRQARSAVTRLSVVHDGRPRLAAPARIAAQAQACDDIVEALMVSRERALHFDLRLLSSLLEMAFVEAGRMIRRAEMMTAKLSPVPANKASAVTGNFKASTRARAAGEIADVLVALRARAQEFDLKFLNYLLEMAFIEAFEQSQKEDA